MQLFQGNDEETECRFWLTRNPHPPTLGKLTQARYHLKTSVPTGVGRNATSA
ncbi:MAG: hypothetical protein HOL01_08060 [Planctomycetaceae bacterium]|nr:hypothetical protein [Planctomycetaceae bacterium]MBT6494492.1 hypothetical protein [Planctomycetaceae bacterium]